MSVADHQHHSVQSTGYQRPQEAQPAISALGLHDVDADNFARTALVDAVGDNHRLFADPPVFAHAHVQGVEHQVRIGRFQSAFAESLNLNVQLGAQHTDLRLGHVGDTELVQHPFNFSRANARDEHLLDGGYECSFAALAVLDEGRNEVPFTRPRDL